MGGHQRQRANRRAPWRISGALAGLAGGIELLGVTHRLFERFAAGYGYSGIAVALLAQLHPLATIASAFFFGALVTGAGELQRTRRHLVDRGDARPGARDPGVIALRRRIAGRSARDRLLAQALPLAIVASTPLLLAVEGELVVERAGMINLGIEGMMLTAAMTAVVAAQLTHSALARLRSPASPARAADRRALRPLRDRFARRSDRHRHRHQSARARR